MFDGNPDRNQLNNSNPYQFPKQKPEEIKSKSEKKNILEIFYSLPSLKEKIKQHYLIIKNHLKVLKKDRLFFDQWLIQPNDDVNGILNMIKDQKFLLQSASYLVFMKVPTNKLNQNVYYFLIQNQRLNKLLIEVQRQSMILGGLVCEYLQNRQIVNKEEQNQIKQIGKWIGSVTFAIDKPIFTCYFDIKQFLIRSLNNGSSLNVVNFIAYIISELNSQNFFDITIPYINSLFDLLNDIMNLQWILESERTLIRSLFTIFQINQNELFPFKHIVSLKNKGYLGFKYIQLKKLVLNGFNSNVLKPKTIQDLKIILGICVEQTIQDIINIYMDKMVEDVAQTVREIGFKDLMFVDDEKEIQKSVFNFGQHLIENLMVTNSLEQINVLFKKNVVILLSQLTKYQKVDIEKMAMLWLQTEIKSMIKILKNIFKEKLFESIQQDEEFKNLNQIRENCYEFAQSFPEELKPQNFLKNLENTDIYQDNDEEREKQIYQNELNVLELWMARSTSTYNQWEANPVIDLIHHLMQELDRQFLDSSNQVMQQILNNIQIAVFQLKENDDALFTFSIVILGILFKESFQTPQGQNKAKILMELLNLFYKNSSNLSKDITKWIVDNHKICNHPQLLCLIIRMNILDIVLFDKICHEIIDTPQNPFFLCIINVIKTLITEDKIFSIHSFQKISEKIVKITKNHPIETPTMEINIFLQNLIEYIQDPNSLNKYFLLESGLQSEYKKIDQDVIENFEIIDQSVYQIVQQIFKLFQQDKQSIQLIKYYFSTVADKGDKIQLKFFCYCLDIAMRNRTINGHTDYRMMNSFCDLFINLISKSDQPNLKLEKILTALIIIIQKINTNSQEEFNQSLVLKFIVRLMKKLKDCQNIRFQGIQASVILAQTLHILQPLRQPNFAFQWMYLLMTKFLVKNLLTQKSLWPLYTILLQDLFQFFKIQKLNEFLALDEGYKFYEGATKIIVVLVHDFPEFMCYECYNIIDHTPLQFKQLRNLMLSAYPKHLDVQNPFQPRMQKRVQDNIIPQPTHIQELRMNSHGFGKKLVNYFKLQNNQSLFMTQLQEMFYYQIKDQRKINHQLTQSFILFVPYFLFNLVDKENQFTNRLQHFQLKTFELFQFILEQNDWELNDNLIRTMFDQLRFPNLITNFFSQFLLWFLNNSKELQIIELILSQLMDRLMVQKPHSWGLLQFFYQMLISENLKEKDFQNECGSDLSQLVQIVLQNYNITFTKNQFNLIKLIFQVKTSI